MDHKNRKPTPRQLENALLERLRDVAGQVDAIILLDQLTEENTGVLTQAVREAAAQLGREHPELLLFADSRAFIDRFHDVVIKCNNLEAAALTGMPGGEPFRSEDVFAALDALSARTGGQVVVTCNAHGVAVRDGGKPGAGSRGKAGGAYRRLRRGRRMHSRRCKRVVRWGKPFRGRADG